MRFLIDEDVDVRLLGALRRWGHEATRVPSGTQNGAVMRLAQEERRVLITRDADFTDSAKYPPSHTSGIIHVDIHPPRIGLITPSLSKLLEAVPASAFRGRLFVVDETGFSDFS